MYALSGIKTIGVGVKGSSKIGIKAKCDVRKISWNVGVERERAINYENEYHSVEKKYLGMERFFKILSVVCAVILMLSIVVVKYLRKTSLNSIISNEDSITFSLIALGMIAVSFMICYICSFWCDEMRDAHCFKVRIKYLERG